jgi:hypothetical protein
MDITEDMNLCEKILDEYKNLTPEDGRGAFKLSQLAVSMYDRLNELRFKANKIKLAKELNMTKTDLKEYLNSKMKVMDNIHVECRVIFTSFINDSRRFKRN